MQPRMSPADRLLSALRRPESVTALTLPQWEVLLGAARQTRLLAHLECRLSRADIIDRLPSAVVNALRAAAIEVHYQQRRALWEADRLQRTLGRAGIPFILVKGGAYLLLDMSLACGREMRDIDLLIPQARIDRAEQVLAAAGWGGVKLDDYDQHYYREWMHELPPMRHPQRVTEVDLHHTILPRTARLHPDPTLLFQQARPSPRAGIGVLCPQDMLLHAIVHLFYDGALDRDLRDLIDIDAMLHEFGREAGFWDGLVDRAGALELQRPLYYALRYSVRILATPVPQTVTEQAKRGAPGAITRRVMDALVPRALLPSQPYRHHPMTALARWLLYLRSHWLRMPPLMLAKHLWRKGVTSQPGQPRWPF